MTSIQRIVDKSLIVRAIERGQGYLIAHQCDGGAWPGRTDLGPQTTAEALLALATQGALEPDLTAKALAYFRSLQLADGSFAPYPGGRSGTLEQTAVVYAALIAAGVSANHPMASQAWAAIRSAGGLARCPLMAKIWLVVAGVLDPQQLPDFPVGWVLTPGIEHRIGRMFAPAFTLMVMFLPALVRALKQRDPRRPGVRERLYQHRVKLEHQRIITYLTHRQNPTGNWFGAANFTALIVIALRQFGVPANDPRVQRGLRDLMRSAVERETSLRFVPFDAMVWNTAITTTTLTQAGLRGDTRIIASALTYLLRRQSNWPQPRDWQVPARGTPRIGGWPFGDANPLACDCDTTSKVLHALSHHQHLDPAIETAIEVGQTWLWGMQHSDGGWGAFRQSGATKRAGPFPLHAFEPPQTLSEALELLRHPPIALDDPATADLTGRVLQALGALGYTTRDPRVARAVRFLWRQQCHGGLWWGRWETNYLPGSAEVLSGLAAVGVSASDMRIVHAVKTIFARQNMDGGWGESVDSYENLALVGYGESSAYVTGIVLRALVDLGLQQSPAVTRAVEYLLAHQQPDGSWPEGDYQFTLQWPWPFYRLELTNVQYPVLALARYRQKLVQNM